MRSVCLERGAIVLLAIAGGSALPAVAQELPFPPRQAEICIDSGGRKIVDKRKLARYLLTKHPFNAAAVPDDPPGANGNLDLPRRIIADPAICVGNKACKKADQESVAGIRGSMAALLIGAIPGFR